MNNVLNKIFTLMLGIKTLVKKPRDANIKITSI